MRSLLSALFVVSFVFLLSAVGQAIDDESLVLYFPFDERTGDIARDPSGNNNNGTINGAEWTEDGKIGKALSFDGSDTVTVKDNDTLDVTSLTVEAWIKPSTDWQQGIGTNPGIFHKLDYPNRTGYLLYLEDAFGTASLYVPQTDTYIRSITNVWKKGIWYHVASTYDEKEGEGKTYVNGKLETTEKSSGKLPPNNQDLIIGMYINTFDGIIDEAAIYNRALTEEEINQDMNNGVIFAVSPAGKLTTMWGSLKNDLR